MHSPSVTLLAGSLLLFSATTLGASILAFAPITALSGQFALEARHIGGSCPAASQTSCADGLGCCPSGAACTYSGQLPVCDELCGSGPKCSNGGCCQAGYFCGVTNDFCTPSPTGIAKMPTFSGPVNAPVTTPTTTAVTSASGSEEDISSSGGTINHPTATSTSTRSTQTGGTSGSSHTPSNTAGRSRTSTSTSTKSTTTKTGKAGGGVVAKTSSRATPTPSSTGAAASLDAVTALAALGFGWITAFFVIL